MAVTLEELDARLRAVEEQLAARLANARASGLLEGISAWARGIEGPQAPVIAECDGMFPYLAQIEPEDIYALHQAPADPLSAG